MVTKEEAKKYLSNVPDDRCFWVNNGPVLRNLAQLAKAISSMSNDTFSYHANNNKNDFSSWINDVVGYKKLAGEMASSKNRASALKKLMENLNYLKKRAS